MKDSARILLMTAALLATGLVNAQDARPITLKEAIDLSVSNSKQLKISKAKVDEASAKVKEALQKKLPDASASGSYLWLSNANVDIKNPNNNGGGGAPSISQALYGIVNLSLPVYAGGRIRYGIESSKFLAQAEELDAENDKEGVIENTIEAYINLYKAKAAVDLVNENLGQAQHRVNDFRNLEKNGLMARNDLLKAELQTSNTELSLLDAQNNWQLANVNMDLMLGLPEQTVLVPDSTMLDQKLSVNGLDEYVQAALRNRKDIEALGFRKQAADLGVKSTKAESYPSIALTGGYIAADIPKLLTITNAVNIGVGFSYNIGSLWKTKAKVEGAEARARQIEATQELMSNNLRLEVNKAYLNWLSSQKKIEVYAKAIEQAEENYRITKNKYDNSLATTAELLDADIAQLQAKLNYTFARADAIVVYNQLLQSSGLLIQPQ
jgi:outer membrane protein TolC